MFTFFAVFQVATWDQGRNGLPGPWYVLRETGTLSSDSWCPGAQRGGPHPPHQDHVSLYNSWLPGASHLHWTQNTLHDFSLKKKQMSLWRSQCMKRNLERKNLGSSENPGLEWLSMRPPWPAFCIHVICRSVFYPPSPLSLGLSYFTPVGISAFS